MKKIGLLLIFILLTGCSQTQGCKHSDAPCAKEWTGFFYPDGHPGKGDIECEIQEGFESLDACEQWAQNKTVTAPSAEYDCGQGCTYTKDCQFGCAEMKEPLAVGIHDFTECEQNGGLIMESYPRQCRVEGQDQTFVEKIEIPWDENEFEVVESQNTPCKDKEDCETPPEYLMRSICPYSSRCIENECYTVCPEPFNHPQTQ